MGNPFNKGPLPPFIEQGGKGDTMWDKCPPTYYVHFLANICSRSTLSIRLFPPVSTRVRNSSRHPSPPNLHIHRNVPKGEEKRGRFRLRVSTELSADLALLPGVHCSRSRTVRFRADLTFGPHLPLRRLDPTPVVGHSPRFLHRHSRNVVPQ